MCVFTILYTEAYYEGSMTMTEKSYRIRYVWIIFGVLVAIAGVTISLIFDEKSLDFFAGGASPNSY